jgi:hypothetical protein
MINYRAAFAIAGLMALVSTGCRGTAGLVPAGAAARLSAERSVELDGSAVAVCSDGDYLLVLEASGTRIVRLDAELVPVETIPLTERLVGPAALRPTGSTSTSTTTGCCRGCSRMTSSSSRG